MNKFFALAAAGTIAIVASLSATAPSSAFDPGVGIAAGILGFAAGAAIVSASEHDRYRNDYYSDSDWQEHVYACEDAYRSYRPRSDTYIGLDGYAHRCRL